MPNIEKYFGSEFLKRDKRIESYRFLQNLIKGAHNDWSTTPDTENVVDKLLSEFKNLDDLEFAFFINHCGYIPETYLPDSSEERLYSKLIEASVLEWAQRIGFQKSSLPKQKASTEDVTITDGNSVIVCDTKSFRLGRSQKAPNVKDALKPKDIQKWLSKHPSVEPLGGLVVFPSQHDWKDRSDFYQYTTDASEPTIALHYEYLSYFLISSVGKQALIDSYRDYKSIFPKPKKKSEGNKDYYHRKITRVLFDKACPHFEPFMETAAKITHEMVYYWERELDDHIKEIKERVKERFETEDDLDTLRDHVVKLETLKQTEDLSKQRNCIAKFRDSSGGFLS